VRLVLTRRQWGIEGSMQTRTLPLHEQRYGDSGRFYAPAVTELDRDELYVLWSCARAEANLALDAWRETPGVEAYVAYRAAEDRADAAQDALALL
jgi:hypothetical protein